MKKRTLTVNYALLISFYWMGYAVLNAFASLYLLDHGFTNTVIGILMAIAGGLSSLLQPIISAYADREKSLPLRKILAAIGAAIVILSILLFPAAPISGVLVAILYTSGVMLLQTMLPLVNALAMDTMNQGLAMNFGVARSMGSVGYALIAYVMGITAGRFGSVIVPIMALTMFALFACSAWFYPVGKAQISRSAQADSSGSFTAFFKKYKRYMFMLSGMILVYTSHVVLNNYTLQITVSKGGTSADMGTITAISAFIEVPIMCLAFWYIKRFRVDILVRISAVFFFLKSLGTLLAGSIPMYYAVQIFQALGWGLMAVVLVYYINGLVAPEDSVKGQGYATMANTLGCVLGAVVGGRLLDISVQVMLIFGTTAAGIGALIVCLNAEKPVKTE